MPLFDKTIISFLLVLFFSMASCQPEKDMTYLGLGIDYKPSVDIAFTEIVFEPLINETLFYSGYGGWIIFNDSLTFLDKILDSAYVFSDDLIYQSSYLGNGDGPNLLTNIILGYTKMDSFLIILGANYDYHLVNKNWEIEQRGMLDFYHERTSFKELEQNPKGEYVGIYEVLFEHLKLGHDYKGNLIFSIASTHPKFNYIWHEKYYQEGRIIGKANPNNGKVSIHGRYSSIYSQYKYLSTMIGAPFAYLDANTYIQGYEADSLLYKLTESGEAIYSFGKSGKDMNVVFSNFKADDMDEYDAIWSIDRKRFSYYYSLDYVGETGLLFRGYTKINPAVDGLQVYRDDILVGDVEVPKDFRFVGYKAPYYYGELRYRRDKEENPLMLLRFKLNEN